MTMPYENQLLGAFLYALDYHGGQRRAVPAAANLLQQTPLDQVFGDLIVGASRCLALEFKRDKGALAGERRKWPEGSLRAAWADINVRQVCVMICSRGVSLFQFSLHVFAWQTPTFPWWVRCTPHRYHQAGSASAAVSRATSGQMAIIAWASEAPRARIAFSSQLSALASS